MEISGQKKHMPKTQLTTVCGGYGSFGGMLETKDYCVRWMEDMSLLGVVCFSEGSGCVIVCFRRGLILCLGFRPFC